MKRLILGFALVFGAACTSASNDASDAGHASNDGADAAEVPCAKDSDCSGHNPTCAFRVADGCGARGVCVTTNGAGSCDAATRSICACDGTTKAISGHCDLPAGFEHDPESHAGACETDAGHD